MGIESAHSCRGASKHWLTLALVLVLATAACESDGSGSSALVGDDYVAAVGMICVDTDARLDALPSPPDGISATDWASEVSLAFSAEAERSGDLFVDSSVRGQHLDFVTTTSELADRYRELSTTVTDDPDGIGALSAEITELSLGRNAIAAEMGLTDCVRSES